MANNHTYAPGDLVERISTGERSQFMRLLNGGTEIETIHWFAPVPDCRPVAGGRIVMKTGIELIAEERARQMERYDTSHDDEHTGYELSQAASYYCIADDCHDSELVFPSNWDSSFMSRTGFPYPSMRDLIKAGALIAAEIDRLQRSKAAEGGE